MQHGGDGEGVLLVLQGVLGVGVAARSTDELSTVKLSALEMCTVELSTVDLSKVLLSAVLTLMVKCCNKLYFSFQSF